MPDEFPTPTSPSSSVPSTTVGILGRMRAAWKNATLGQRLVTAGAAGGTVIGLLAIIVPLIFMAATRPTTTDTVGVSSQSNDAGTLEAVSGAGPRALSASVGFTSLVGLDEYAVPIDAPWAELWAAGDPVGCYTDAQLAWLEQHGVLIPPQFLTTEISNTADSGSALTISEIRAQGQLTPPPVDTVTVGYYACIGDGADGVFAHITVGVDAIAVFDDCYSTGDCRNYSTDVLPIPGDPVTFSILPGETQILNLSFDQTVDFTGRFVATIEVDGKTETIDLSPGNVDIVAPTVTRQRVHLTIGSVDVTRCTGSSEPGSWIEGCTLEQWLAILEAD